MRHLLMDPAFPDLIAQWAEEKIKSRTRESANDNAQEHTDELRDPLLDELARLELGATRIW